MNHLQLGNVGGKTFEFRKGFADEDSTGVEDSLGVENSKMKLSRVEEMVHLGVEDFSSIADTHI
jgi:hypothetical protein